jgi:hypothetical protein
MTPQFSWMFVVAGTTAQPVEMILLIEEQDKQKHKGKPDTDLEQGHQDNFRTLPEQDNRNENSAEDSENTIESYDDYLVITEDYDEATETESSYGNDYFSSDVNGGIASTATEVVNRATEASLLRVEPVPENQLDNKAQEEVSSTCFYHAL